MQSYFIVFFFYVDIHVIHVAWLLLLSPPPPGVWLCHHPIHSFSPPALLWAWAGKIRIDNAWRNQRRPSWPYSTWVHILVSNPNTRLAAGHWHWLQTLCNKKQKNTLGAGLGVSVTVTLEPLKRNLQHQHLIVFSLSLSVYSRKSEMSVTVSVVKTFLKCLHIHYPLSIHALQKPSH